jgi:hypothetical protein
MVRSLAVEFSLPRGARIRNVDGLTSERRGFEIQQGDEKRSRKKEMGDRRPWLSWMGGHFLARATEFIKAM